MRGDIKKVLAAFENYTAAKAAGEDTGPAEWEADSALTDYVKQVMNNEFRRF